uniref:40S ribosomal protein S21 n=1 Tax=Spermophilus dauricus TaxID=99837 RepID=A0A8C9PW44_SPEDA
IQNDAGEFVDLYMPRKCSASNGILGAKEHVSIHMNVAKVDKVTGRFNRQFKTYAVCRTILRMGDHFPTHFLPNINNSWTKSLALN